MRSYAKLHIFFDVSDLLSALTMFAWPEITVAGRPNVHAQLLARPLQTQWAPCFENRVPR